MTMKITLSFFIALFLASIALAQREKSVLLQGDEAKRLANQCSRESPSDFTDLWKPTSEDLQKMESRLGRVSDLRSKCCMEQLRIDSPYKWYMQYAGLIWKGKKIIYISGFATSKPTELIVNETTKKSKEIASDRWKVHPDHRLRWRE